MYTTLKKVNQGFTIVETLIVLAIAALIITIILIAVPDLQRSGRNTNILHDAQNVASAVQTYEGNNQGAIPTQTTAGVLIVSSGVIVIGTSSGASASAHVQQTDSIYYAAALASSGTEAVAYSGSGAASATNMGPGDIVVVPDSTCGTVGTTNTVSYDGRSITILYPIEGASASNGSTGCIQE